MLAADQLTVDAGGQIAVLVGGGLTIYDGAGADLTNEGSIMVASGGSLTTSGSLVNNGTAQIMGFFNLYPGGDATSGTGTYDYDPTGVLYFYNTSPVTVNDDIYWPTLNGPNSVGDYGSGGITLNVPRSVAGFVLQSSLLNANNLTVTGNLQVEAGGSISGSPTYGPSAAISYGTAGVYERGDEWLAGTTSGPGYPHDVFVNAGTTVNLGNGALRENRSRWAAASRSCQVLRLT